MKTHIKNGHLIDPANGINEPRDLVIENSRILDVLKSGSRVNDADVIDAKGLIVAPGFVDLHTHLREPGFEYKETIETGTRSAAAGGFTSVCCMANTDPVNDSASVTDFILDQARKKGVVNVFPVGALTRNLEGKQLSNIGDLKLAGCVALSDDGNTTANPQVLRLAMEYARTFDLPVIEHCVDDNLAAGGVMNESFVSTKLGLKGIPNAAEDIIIARDIYLSRLTGCPLHIAHLTTAEGLRLIKMAKERGVKVTCEVTPHHLALTDEAVGEYNTNAKMMPPLRRDEDRQALIAGIREGIIDAIATDHAPHATVDKDVEFDRAACGVVGLETAFAVVNHVFRECKIPLQKALELMTIKPAGIVGLDKGTLSKGADADVVILDPAASFTVDAGRFFTKSKNSPFDGRRLTGRVKWTIVGGKVVYADSSTACS